MTDPFAFNPTKLTWEICQGDDGRHTLDVCYRLPGDSELSISHHFDNDVAEDPLQIAGVVGAATRRVILSFQQIVVNLSAHDKLLWISSLRKDSECLGYSNPS